MDIRSLHFDHLITFQVRDKKENWLEGIKILEDFPLNHEVYQNGPVFFSYEEEKDNEGLFTYYLPINDAVEFEEGITDFEYIHQFSIEKAILMRQAQEEADFSTAIQKIKSYAATENIAVDNSFICVLLDVYGEYLIDLYVPLKEWSEVK